MKPSLRTVEAEIRKSDPNAKGRDFDAAVVLLASAIIGPSIVRLAKFTRRSREVIRPLSKNWRKNRIWVGGRVDAGEWFGATAGGVAFWMHVCCGLGFLQRGPSGS